MRWLAVLLFAVVALGACESDSTTFDSPAGVGGDDRRQERREERRLERRREARQERRRAEVTRERRQERRREARIERRLERQRERRQARRAAAAAAPQDDGGGENCTPGYSPCLPPASDYDCAGGTGDGPEYVQGPVEVSGDDPYGLDDDDDNVGCEA